MKIVNHILEEGNGISVSFKKSPNTGGSLDHRFLVMHFTAGQNAESSINWLTNPESRASAHLVIARDGSITQLVPFNTIAWHAGRSNWEGLSGLNKYSIGIELDNAGKLIRHGDKWQAWFGRDYDQQDVIEAIHKNESTPAGWHIYTREQLDAALQVSIVLMTHYKLKDFLGHEDIAPGRKFDPGPAFPMGSFHGKLLGRMDDTETEYKTITALNIRTGPGTQHKTLPVSPLPKGTRLKILRAQESWRLVDVLGKVKGVMDIQGWVHSRYISQSG